MALSPTSRNDYSFVSLGHRVAVQLPSMRGHPFDETVRWIARLLHDHLEAALVAGRGVQCNDARLRIAGISETMRSAAWCETESALLHKECLGTASQFEFPFDDEEKLLLAGLIMGFCNITRLHFAER